MVCNDCGTSNENDAKFCIHCGGAFSMFRRVKVFLQRGWFRTDFSHHKNPFFQAFIDTSFSQLVSLKIIKRVYGLSILFAGLVALLFIIAGFHSSLWFGMLVLFICAPLTFLLIALYSRVLLELVLFNFGTADCKAKKEDPPEPVDSIEWNV
jgi:hypothetical protein